MRLGEASAAGNATPLGWASSRFEASAIQLGHVADCGILTNNNGPCRWLLDQKKKHDILIKGGVEVSPIFLITMIRRSVGKSTVAGSGPVGNNHRPLVVW